MTGPRQVVRQEGTALDTTPEGTGLPVPQPQAAAPAVPGPEQQAPPVEQMPSVEAPAPEQQAPAVRAAAQPAEPVPATELPRDPDMNRRRFLEVAFGVSVGATCALAGITAARAIAPPGRSIDGKTKMPPTALVAVADLQPGKPQAFPFGDDQIFIAKTADGKVIALDAACPHVRCTLHWDEATQQFACPCHASFFKLDGTRISGPAPRGMDKAMFSVVDGKVVVSGIAQA